MARTERAADLPPAPAAPRRAHTIVQHGDERTDPWYWLRERETPDVLAYLEAENAYTDAALAPLAALSSAVFEEIRGRVQETDVSAPVPKDGWDLFTRTFEGQQYAVHGRRPRGAPEGEHEEVLLDENALAGDAGYFALGGFALDTAQRHLAYSVDFTGGERYTLRIRDVAAGEDLPDVIEDVYYGLAWSADGHTLFYVRPDEAVRPYQVWRHRLGTAPAADVLVHEEPDERFFVSVARTRSGDWVVVSIDSKVTSEVLVIPAAAPETPPRVVEPRRNGVEYSVEHHRAPDGTDRFLIVTNDGAVDFRLVATPVSDPTRTRWTELVPARPDVKLDDVEPFPHHLVLAERAQGLERLRVLHLDGERVRTLEMPDPVYSAWIGENLDYESTTLRFGYTSMVLPPSAYDHDLETGETTLVKRQPVLGGYDPDRFVSERVWATAADGTRIPVSIVHRRDVRADGTAAALLYGYGSYEHSVDPTFSVSRLSLLERGVVFAIAHIRGGGEMGRHWYEDGKLQRKQNTFTDFIACAQHLVDHGYAAHDRLAARGGSAGGMLMGVVANLRPDLFRAIVAEVPFVDCLTTMLDPTLPLTVTEWEEWGDPLHDPAAYRTMKSYSPYDNVVPQDYPAMLVTAGLNDPRVSYWEPAKWVAKLRTTKTDDRLLLLKTDLGTGHGGPSGRYDAWREEALILAFLLDQLDAA